MVNQEKAFIANGHKAFMCSARSQKVGICVEKENREVFRKIQFQASQYKNE